MLVQAFRSHWLRWLILSAGIISLVAGCATSPLGRKQLMLFSNSDMEQMGISAYQEMKQKQPLSTAPEVNQYVNCVANSITSTLNSDLQWEVNVFKDDTANAFALPGAKIGVNTGLLTIAQTPDQLASVIGHEVGHVLAHHGNERMSIQAAQNTGLTLANVLAASSDSQLGQMSLGLLGLGAQFGVTLPFSRKHESEADLIGLNLMAKAGFDPRQSVVLWENMASASNGQQPPEFMSTHPANATRIRDLQAHMNEAMNLYQQAQAAGIKPECKRS